MRLPELTAVAAASPPMKPEDGNKSWLRNVVIYLKSSPCTKSTDPVIVISGMIFRYPGHCCLAKPRKESARLVRKIFRSLFRQYGDHQGKRFVSSSHCQWIILFRKFLHATCLTLVALIKWQGSRLVEDESLHWDITESTHVHLATGLISRYWTDKWKRRNMTAMIMMMTMTTEGTSVKCYVVGSLYKLWVRGRGRYPSHTKDFEF